MNAISANLNPRKSPVLTHNPARLQIRQLSAGSVGDRLLRPQNAKPLGASAAKLARTMQILPAGSSDVPASVYPTASPRVAVMVRVTTHAPSPRIYHGSLSDYYHGVTGWPSQAHVTSHRSSDGRGFAFPKPSTHASKTQFLNCHKSFQNKTCMVEGFVLRPGELSFWRWVWMGDSRLGS